MCRLRVMGERMQGGVLFRRGYSIPFLTRRKKSRFVIFLSWIVIFFVAIKRSRIFWESHGPGRADVPVRILETRWPGRADVAWDWNLTDLVGLGPVISKISLAGPGARWARRRRLGLAQPHLRELAPLTKKNVRFEILDFLQFLWQHPGESPTSISFIRIKHRRRADDILCTTEY